MSQRISSEVKKVLKKDSQGRLITKAIIIRVGGKVLVLNLYEYRKFREALGNFDVEDAVGN